jgi:hypothetical protein
MLSPIQLFLFASLPFIAIADSVPKFDMAAECRSEGGSKAMLEKCAEDEAAARDQLPPVWIQSTAADKASCVRKPAWVMHEVLLARAAVKRSQRRPRAKRLLRLPHLRLAAARAAITGNGWHLAIG